jgi:gas vesicle protein
MMATILLIVIVVVIVGAAAGLLFWRHRPRELKTTNFQKKWQTLQKMLRDKKNWGEAVTLADSLLDEALKKKHVNGRNMGERLVKAQRMLTDNDSVWFGHKLRGQLETDPDKRLKEDDVKDALIGIRQALKDLGALPESKKNSGSLK